MKDIESTVDKYITPNNRSEALHGIINVDAIYTLLKNNDSTVDKYIMPNNRSEAFLDKVKDLHCTEVSYSLYQWYTTTNTMSVAIITYEAPQLQ